ncbi:DNA polymerase beta palm-domain-containing protein [Trametes elegans]|nr:DNA polymerase beta palm-domain-containing protein [Trametes elegans]
MSQVQPCQTKQCASGRGFPGAAASRASAIHPPLTFNRRSTVADCSEITSSPNSAPPAKPAEIAAPASPTKRSSGAASRKETKGAAERGPTKTIRSRGKKADRYVTPIQYAEKLQAQLSERPAGKRAQRANLFLKGKRIFYYGGDLNYACEQTRNRMNIITRHGGTLVPRYDPAQITHIVTDTSAGLLLRDIGLEKLSEIPQHIPTVKWSWVVSGVNRAPIRRAAQRNGLGKAPEKGPDRDPAHGVEEDEYEYRVHNEYEHAAYSARLDAGRTPWGEVAKTKAVCGAQKSKVGSKVQAGGSPRTGPAEQSRSADGISNVSEFTQDFAPPRGVAANAPGEVLPSPPSSPNGPRACPAHALESKDAARATRAVQAPAPARGSAARDERGRAGSADPLAEFYAAARAEHDVEVGALRADDDDCDRGEPAAPGGAASRGGRTGTKAKKGFACDDTGARARVGVACPNQDVVDKLEELKAIHEAKGTSHDRLRVQCYVNAVASLRKYPHRIKCHGEAVKIRGVGEKTAEKIMEIIQTGELRRIGHERTPDVAVVNLFRGIYGVGQKTAYMWYGSGCRTLADLAARKGGIRLSAEQEIGLKFYTDVNTRIPRAEVAEIYAKIKATALTLDPKLVIEIMGSYRRGKADCGDIDITITRPTDDGKTHQGVLRQLLMELHRQDVVTEDLCLPDDWDDLELVYRGLCKRDAHGLRRRIDFLTVPWKSRGAASLYYTGDQIVCTSPPQPTTLADRRRCMCSSTVRCA